VNSCDAEEGGAKGKRDKRRRKGSKAEICSQPGKCEDFPGTGVGGKSRIVGGGSKERRRGLRQ